MRALRLCKVTCGDLSFYVRWFHGKIRLVLLCFVVVGQNSPFKNSRRSEKVGIDLSHFMLYFLNFLTICDKNASEYFIEHKRLIKTYFLFIKLRFFPISKTIFTVWVYSDPLFTYRISDFQQTSLNFYSTRQHILFYCPTSIYFLKKKSSHPSVNFLCKASCAPAAVTCKNSRIPGLLSLFFWHAIWRDLWMMKKWSFKKHTSLILFPGIRKKFAFKCISKCIFQYRKL